MNSPTVCSSMRQRSDWASLFPALLQSSSPIGQWKEARLGTHDVAMPLPRPGQPSHLAFRSICLSSEDVGSLETRKRIERLYNLNGGECVAIVFLMKHHNGENGPAFMMKLQMELIGGLEMPIIPIASVQTMFTTLETFHRLFMTSAPSEQRQNPARCLLPYCSDFGTLSEHIVNILSDITKDLKDLVNQATKLQGQEHLVDFLGEDAERIINCWQAEYVVD